jgi:hypothetical protein
LPYILEEEEESDRKSKIENGTNDQIPRNRAVDEKKVAV